MIESSVKKVEEAFQLNDFEINDTEDTTLTNHPLLPSSAETIGESRQKQHEIGDETTDYEQRFVTKYYKGESVVLYPTNYQTVPLVRIQIAACLILFVVFGINDQVTGSLMPTLTKYYEVTELQVSSVFFLQLTGYTLASLLNDTLHRKWGSLGVMTFAASLSCVFFLLLSLKPPSVYLYAACFLPLGLCVGFMDSTGNVIFGNMEIHRNEWMGALHGLYGLAAGVTPPLVTAFDHYLDWSHFFLIPFFFAVCGIILIRIAFKHETAAKFKYICSLDSESDDADVQGHSLLQMMKIPQISLYSLFLFLYLGAEVGIGTWLYTFLLKYKGGERFKMSFVTASFWSGITVGRLFLGFVTKRFKNEYTASVRYGWSCMLFFILFALISLIDSKSNLYFLLLGLSIFGGGVFIGPLFPNASVVTIQILPKSLQVIGIGTAIAFAGCGGAIVPYLLGFAIKYFGFKYFPFICCAIVFSFNTVWMLYPKIIKGYEQFL